MKKRALGLSGKAAMEEGTKVLEREQTKENHAWFVIRGIPLAILEPLPLALPPPRCLLLLFYSLVPPSRPFWPRDPVLFYWFMGFFSRGPPSRTSERADCESSLLLSSTNAFGLSIRAGKKEMRERRRERATKGKEGRTIKKSKCQPP